MMPRGITTASTAILGAMPDSTARPPATTVRLDPALRGRLDDFAAATNRSLLGAMTQLLTEALDARDQGATTPPHGTSFTPDPTPNR